MPARFDVIGLDRLVRNLTLGGMAAAKAGAAGLARTANVIFDQSQEEVPRDTGTLARSGQVSNPRLEGYNAVVEISYGGPAAEYALWVHENLEAYHVPPTKAKYLEGPVLRHINTLGAKINEEIERSIS